MLRNQTEAWFTDRTTFHHLSHAKKKQNVMTTGIGTGLRFSVKNDHDDETVTKLRSRSRGRAARWTRRRKEGVSLVVPRKINKCLHRSPLRRSYRVRVFPWTNPCCPYDIRACGAACS